MLVLALLLPALQAGPAPAQGEEVWFNVDVQNTGGSGFPYENYRITVYKDGRAHGEGPVSYTRMIGSYTFDGSFDKSSRSLTGTVHFNVTVSPGEVPYGVQDWHATLTLNLVDSRNFTGTAYCPGCTETVYGIDETITNEWPSSNLPKIGQADRDVFEGEGPEEGGPEEEPEASTPPGEDSNFRLKMSALKKPGEAYVRRAGSDKLVPADDSTVINFGDTIVIKKGFGAILNLDEGSDMVLPPGSELTVVKKNRLKQFGEAMLRLGEGIKNWFSGDEAKEGFEIETRRANTSITGTVLVINDDGSKCSLKVIEGVAGFTDKASGRTVTVRAGEMIETTEQGLGEVTAFDAQAELAEWESLEAQILAEAEAEADSDGFPAWLLVVIIAAAIVLAVAVVLIVKRGKG